MTEPELYDLLEKIGIKNLRSNGANIMGCCPYHAEKNPSWGIRVEEPHLFGCFGCQARGEVSKLMRDFLGMSYEQSRKEAGLKSIALNQVGGFKTMRMAQLTKSTARQRIPNELKEQEKIIAFKSLKKPSSLVLNWLLRRGLSEHAIKASKLRMSIDRKTLYLPWYRNNKLVYSVKRDVTDGQSKFVGENGEKGAQLYVPPFFTTRPVLFLTESELDAIKICDAGFSAAALGFGTITVEQIQHLFELGGWRVVLAFDCDRTGEKLTKLAKQVLSEKIAVSELKWEKVLAMFQDLRSKYHREGKLDVGDLNKLRMKKVLSLCSAIELGA